MGVATRLVVHIDEDLCNGCGECVPSCAEGAIQIIDGKARLLADNLCDGLGACLGHCPVDAIRLEERPADAFDEDAVERHLADLGHPGHGCPGTQETSIRRAACPAFATATAAGEPALGNWPIQLELVNPRASFLKQADVLLAADCTAFAYPGMRDELQAGRVTLIGCPKLDDAGAYVNKLATILQANEPKSLTLAIMEVPCCSGLARIVQLAQQRAATAVPVDTHVISADGKRVG